MDPWDVLASPICSLDTQLDLVRPRVPDPPKRYSVRVQRLADWFNLHEMPVVRCDDPGCVCSEHRLDKVPVALA